jgi:hypothetical protein
MVLHFRYQVPLSAVVDRIRSKELSVVVNFIERHGPKGIRRDAACQQVHLEDVTV